MLVFFIHGVSTKDSSYADALIKNIKKELVKGQSKNNKIDFYSSFWGNLFNNKKHQIIACIEEDLSQICDKHQEYKQYHFIAYNLMGETRKLLERCVTPR